MHKITYRLKICLILSHNVPTIPPKTKFLQWSLYYHCSNLNAHCSNNHPVPIFDCSNLVSCYREVCSYFLQNIVYRCNYHLFVICYRLCANLFKCHHFPWVCVCVYVDWHFAKQQVGRSAVNSCYAWVCLHYERVVSLCIHPHYLPISLSLRPKHTLSLSLSLTLSLSLSLSLSNIQIQIQNCFIGMTVNDTILPKLSIHVQKDENK